MSSFFGNVCRLALRFAVMLGRVSRAIRPRRDSYLCAGLGKLFAMQPAKLSEDHGFKAIQSRQQSGVLLKFKDVCDVRVPLEELIYTDIIWTYKLNYCNYCNGENWSSPVCWFPVELTSCCSRIISESLGDGASEERFRESWECQNPLGINID